jgi:hypothetical protein
MDIIAQEWNKGFVRERERGDEDEEVRSVLFKLNDFDDFGFKFMNLELSLWKKIQNWFAFGMKMRN